MIACKIADGVSLNGVSAEIFPAFIVAPQVFDKYGHNCYLTSACRIDKLSLHGWGRALDFDSSFDVPEHVGEKIAEDIQEILGANFFCLWHKTKNGNWHLHVEYDPGNKGVRRFTEAA